MREQIFTPPQRKLGELILMRRIIKWSVGLSVFGAFVLLAGFLFFATVVMRSPTTDAPTQRADGIVVLTGGTQRISAGSQLLKRQRGKRLLISGVNRRTKKSDITALADLSAETRACCVDLGYDALDTPGNAKETAEWAEQNKFRSLIIVTSSYHMPRSFAELSRRMPNTELIAYPVLPENFRSTFWWLNANATRVILFEYLKFLPAAAQLAAARCLPNWSDETTSAQSVLPANTH